LRTETETSEIVQQLTCRIKRFMKLSSTRPPLYSQVVSFLKIFDARYVSDSAGFPERFAEHGEYMLRLVLTALRLRNSAPGLNRWVAVTSWEVDLVLRARTSSAPVLLGAALLSSAAFSQPRPGNATIDTSKIGAPISKNICCDWSLPHR
jgi:hypothetical protein